MRKHNVLKKVSVFLALALCIGFAGGALLTKKPAAVAETADATVGYEAVYSSENPIPEIAANVRPSVVQVITSAATWDQRSREVSTEEIGYGSGTYFRALDEGEGGYILTNNHVVDEGETYEIQWLDGTIMDATLVGADEGTDIAVLQFNEPAPEGATPVPLGDSDALQIGELAIVIGNPGSGTEVLFGTVTAGIISGLEREGVTAQGSFNRPVSTIQVDAAINTGNSGGALLNAQGELVGIPTLKMTASYTTIYEGLGFCIPINTAKDIIDQLIENGEVVRPRLGVTVVAQDGPDEPMRNYPPAGVRIENVEEGSPADEAGLQTYDIITEINGVRVYTNDDLIAQIDQYAAGDTVELTICRYYSENGTRLAQYEVFTANVELEIID